tara:strand:+ start:2129 stop:3499 length:1371 start_codon:yes stop_codon:yes gene_type:complete
MKRLKGNKKYAITCFNKGAIFDKINTAYEDTCLKNYLYRNNYVDLEIHYLRIKSYFVNPIKYLPLIFRLKKNTINDLFRLATAKTYKSTLVCETKLKNTVFHFFIKNIYQIKNLLIALALYCKTAYFSKRYKVEFILIDHIAYLNGSLALAARDFEISFYSNDFPYDLRFFKKPKFKFLSDINYFKNERKNKLNFENREYELDYMNDLEYISDVEKYEFNKYDYVLYCHSFSDANNYYGWDGAFKNILDWTIYTLDNLKDKNVLIKPHPNIFFNDVVMTHSIDLKLYEIILNKYKNIKNFNFLNIPIDNFQFMTNLKKSAILITHHGTMIGECASEGFKIISSKINFLYDLEAVGVNIWKSKDEYLYLLKTNFDNLKAPRKFDTLDYYQLFKNTYGTYLNEESWKTYLSKLCSFDRKVLEIAPPEIDKMLEKILLTDPPKYQSFIKNMSEREIVEF